MSVWVRTLGGADDPSARPGSAKPTMLYLIRLRDRMTTRVPWKRNIKALSVR